MEMDNQSEAVRRQSQTGAARGVRDKTPPMKRVRDRVIQRYVHLHNFIFSRSASAIGESNIGGLVPPPGMTT